jgi:hypothetical protein
VYFDVPVYPDDRFKGTQRDNFEDLSRMKLIN